MVYSPVLVSSFLTLLGVAVVLVHCLCFVLATRLLAKRNLLTRNHPPTPPSQESNGQPLSKPIPISMQEDTSLVWKNPRL